MTDIVPLETAWITGFVLAMCRIGAFVVVSPFVGRAIPAPARVAFTIALSMAGTHPVTGIRGAFDLAAAASVNVAIGAALGFLTGLIAHMFASAGGTIDIVSGLAVATVFDPLQGSQGGVFARMFHLTAITAFAVSGGLTLLVTGLLGSIRLLPLGDGVAVNPTLGADIVRAFGDMTRAAVELALPVMGVLLLIELSLGIASRFAPQANVFLLGLPAKLLTSITVVGSSWVLFPDALRLTEESVTQMFTRVVGALVGSPS